MTKLILECDNQKVTFESQDEDITFSDVLQGFLGCMFGVGYIPGTEMRCFKEYINGMEPLYASKE